uniref:Uncharacterized protein n=1 Tax=Leersia perrieri TaxID=77586 RepID=A0A0D9WJL2_9ORYZ
MNPVIRRTELRRWLMSPTAARTPPPPPPRHHYVGPDVVSGLASRSKPRFQFCPTAANIQQLLEWTQPRWDWRGSGNGNERSPALPVRLCAVYLVAEGSPAPAAGLFPLGMYGLWLRRGIAELQLRRTVNNHRMHNACNFYKYKYL